MKKQLCNITKVSTQYQDRKILILDVWAELEDSGVFSCFNMVLDSWDGKKKRRTGTSYGCEMIIQCLDFFGVCLRISLWASVSVWVYVSVLILCVWDQG